MSVPDMEMLRACGIDTGEGLACCADDEAFYGEMLGEFARDGRVKLGELGRFFEARAWRDYGVRAHAVKSSARMIGASGVSERARALEAAARDGDEGAILAGHAAFLAAYAELIDNVCRALGETP